MRGQGALEYFIIFSALLLVFSSVTLPQMINPANAASLDVLRVAQGRDAAGTIANAIDGVYANSEGAVITGTVHIDSRWSLKIESDPSTLTIGVGTSEGVENVIDNPRYEFGNLGLGGLENIVSNLPSGNYTVITEWTSDSKEGIDNSSIENRKIYIYINPEG